MLKNRKIRDKKLAVWHKMGFIKYELNIFKIYLCFLLPWLKLVKL